jgi:hypothetical protein
LCKNPGAKYLKLKGSLNNNLHAKDVRREDPLQRGAEEEWSRYERE